MTLAPPYSENDARPRGKGYGARLNGSWYRLAVSDTIPLELLTQDELAERSADGTNSFENMLRTGYAFVRGNFTGGEGLDRYPRTPPGALDDTRYWASNNLDLRRPEAGRPYSISLANRFHHWHECPDGVIEVRATVDKLYAACDTEIISWTSPDDPSEDTSFTFPAAVLSFDVTDADEGAALLVDGSTWHKPIGTTVWTNTAPSIPGPELDNVQGIWMVKGRIMVWIKDPASATYSQLVEVGLGVTGTPAVPAYSVDVHIVDTFAADVIDVIDAGLCVLAITTDRVIRSYVTRQDSSSAPPLLTLVSSTPLPKGEQPVAVAYNSGVVVILTAWGNRMRAYSAEMLDEKFNFIVSNLTQLREWDDVVVIDTPMVRQITVARDEFLWLIANTDGSTDLWRYDVVTTGVHRHTEVSDELRDGLVWWQDRVYVFTRGELDLDRTETDFCAEGWLITPLINFNLNAPINWVELTLQAYELGPTAGVQVQVSISAHDDALLDPNHRSWRVVAQLSSSTIDVLSVPLIKESWPKLALKLVLRSHTSGTITPRVTQVGVRGIPAAQETTVTLPVSIADQVEAPGRMPVRIPGFGNMLFESLLSLRGRAVDCEVVAPPLRIRGVVRSVSSAVSYLSDRGGVGYYSLVSVLGEPVVAGAAQLGLGGEGLGVGALGRSLIGVGGME